jgi:beta-phosphoglucomutase-like phosphatase (HAD superfamily)
MQTPPIDTEATCPRCASIKAAVASNSVTPRMIERILRDAGLPKAFAKRVVASGYKSAGEIDEKSLADIRDTLRAAAERISTHIR